MRKSFELLRELLNIPSPSGFEEEAASKWLEYVGKFTATQKDVYGNSIAELSLPARPHSDLIKIMLVGHIDEVGMMVNYISDDGFIYISKIGGVEPTVLPAQMVDIHNKNGVVKGVIGRRPPHLADEDEDDEIKFHNVFVDIGAKDKEDAVKQVSVGDPITFDAPCCELINEKIVGRGVDDKVGAFVVARVLEELSHKEIFIPIVGVASIQEENGAYGAMMVAKSVKPSAVIVVDVTHATDVPDISKEKHGDCKLGEGPVLSIGSASHKDITASLEEIATKNRIPIQKQISPRWTGTDADVIFTENGGIPTALVSIPNRYMHSPVEMIDLNDVENAIKLITKWYESK